MSQCSATDTRSHTTMTTTDQLPTKTLYWNTG